MTDLGLVHIPHGFSILLTTSETYLIQLIQRPLQNKPDERHLASQSIQSRSSLVLEDLYLCCALTRRPFLLFSLIC